MQLSKIIECLKKNGFTVTGFSSAYSDSGREVCSHGYVYKGKTQVASISRYDKHITVLAKVKGAYGGHEIFEVIPFNKVTEDILKNLKVHSEQEYNERKLWWRQYSIRCDIQNVMDDVNKYYPKNKEMKQKLKEAFEFVKDIKEPPSML